MYNDDSSPACPYIVFTEYHPGNRGTCLYPEAIRAAMTDLYGGVTLLIYKDDVTCNHRYEQEVIRTQPTPSMEMTSSTLIINQIMQPPFWEK